MVIPPDAPRVLELRRRPAVHHHEQRVFFLRVEPLRLHEQIRNRPALRAGKIKPLHRRQIELRQLPRVELRERAIRARRDIESHHLRRTRRAVKTRHKYVAADAEPGQTSRLRHVMRLHRAARRRHGKQLRLLARLRREVNRLTVRARHELHDRQPKLRGQRRALRRVKGPRKRHHAVVGVGLAVAAHLVLRDQRLAVRPKRRLIVAPGALGQLRRLTARNRHRKQLRRRRRVGGLIPRRARDKDHTLPVRCPDRRQALAGLRLLAAEPG